MWLEGPGLAVNDAPAGIDPARCFKTDCKVLQSCNSVHILLLEPGYEVHNMDRGGLGGRAYSLLIMLGGSRQEYPVLQSCKSFPYSLAEPGYKVRTGDPGGGGGGGGAYSLLIMLGGMLPPVSLPAIWDMMSLCCEFPGWYCWPVCCWNMPASLPSCSHTQQTMDHRHR